MLDNEMRFSGADFLGFVFFGVSVLDRISDRLSGGSEQETESIRDSESGDGGNVFLGVSVLQWTIFCRSRNASMQRAESMLDLECGS